MINSYAPKPNVVTSLSLSSDWCAINPAYRNIMIPCRCYCLGKSPCVGGDLGYEVNHQLLLPRASFTREIFSETTAA